MANSPVTAQDLDAVLDVAESLVNVSSLDVLRRRTVEVLPDLVPCNLVAWNEVELDGSRIAAVLSANQVIPDNGTFVQLENAFIRNVKDHPVIAHYQQTHDGRPLAISDFLSAKAFHATGIYQEFYRHLGAEDQISFVLPDPSLIVGIAANRSERGFSTVDRTVCGLLRCYLLQAYRNVDARTRAERVMSGLQQLSDEHEVAVVLLDRAGTPEYISQRAQDLMRRHFGVSNGQLPPDLRRWLDEQAATTFSPPRLYAGGHSEVMVRRVQREAGDILLFDEHITARATTAGHQLGLSDRQTEVLSLLARGKSSKQIGTTLGISSRTVDKHVAMLLDKLSVQTRLEAVALLANR